MVVDYSKWDKLEVSDDSDIEVHPNVDKKSFIRWKQQSIHEEREKRKASLNQMIEESKVYERVYPLICGLLDKIKEKQKSDLNKEKNENNEKNENIEDKESKTKEINNDDTVDDLVDKYSDDLKENVPRYGSNTDARVSVRDIFVNLIAQIRIEISKVKDENTRVEKFIERLEFHIKKIENLEKDRQNVISGLKKEMESHITSEDIHDKFSTTVINKDDSSSSAKSGSKNDDANGNKSVVTEEIEVLNSPKETSSLNKKEKNKEKSNDDSFIPSKDAIEFAKIKPGDFKSHLEFISKHKHILTEHEKDSLLMHAFDLQLKGNQIEAKLTVYNALIIQYCLQLGPDGTSLFFKRATENQKGLQFFLNDVEQTYAHIQKRCVIIAKEQAEAALNAEAPKEIVQLHTTNSNDHINISTPPANPQTEEEKEARSIFDSFPFELRTAIEEKSLEKVNKYLEDLSVEEAEVIIDSLNKGKMLDIVEGVLDGTEWEKQKEIIENEHNSKNEDETVD